MRETDTGSSGISRPVWETDGDPPVFSPLQADTEADVCVIGAGIAGLTAAYLAAGEGKSVVVLEDGRLGGGETGRSSGHLANALDDLFTELEKQHGAEGARLAAESHGAAIDFIESVVAREKINCDFRRLDGYLFAPPEGDIAELEREFSAARGAGLEVAWARGAPIPGFKTGRCLRFARQAQFNPLKYVLGLARAAVGRGARVFTGTHAAEVTNAGGRKKVRTAAGPAVTAAEVVVATNTPVTHRVALHTKQAAYRTYVIAGPVPAGSVPWALYWDTEDPYHYVRLHKNSKGEEFLIVGGEDHKTGQADDADDRYRRLENWAWERFPFEKARFRWSGQIIEPVDGLAFIGRDKDGVCLVTGDSGNGLTHGSLAGMLINDLIHGRSNPWAALYDPSRRPMRASAEFAKENANVLPQYGDWFKKGEAAALNDIAPGEAAVVRRGLKKLAVYREESGELHVRSAVCSHLGCIVRWNHGEKTWDCPCHGSRFDHQGRVLNGPANRDLAAVRTPKKSPVPGR